MYRRRKSLVLVLIVSLLTSGCATQSSKNVSTTHIGIQSKSFENPLEISIGFWNIRDMEIATEKDGVWQYIEDLLNITIKPVHLNWSDYNERYLIMGVSNTLPDVFAATTISGTSESDTLRLNDMVSRNMLRALPKDLSNFPNVEETVASLSQYLLQPDGEIYTFPRTSFSNIELSSSDAGMLVRKDWLEALGLDTPNSLQEFQDMVTAFAKEDPDGNGINDTIGYNSGSRMALGKWLILGIAPECNVYSWVVSEGKFVPSYTLPEFEKVIIAYRALYKSKGLDPDFYIKKTTDPVYDFAKGDLGTLEYKTSPSALSEIRAYWYKYHDTSEKFEDHVACLNIFPAEDGVTYSNGSSPFWSESLFSSTVSEEKMERILYLYDFLMSQEGWYLTRFGIENVDYEMINGSYHCLLNTTEESLNQTLMKKYPSINLFSSLATWGGTDTDFELSEQNNLRYGETIMEMTHDSLEWNISKTQMVERPYPFLQMNKKYMDTFTTAAIIDEFTKVIIGSNDPVKMWRKVLENWNDQGFSAYIDEINAQAAELDIFPETATTPQ